MDRSPKVTVIVPCFNEEKTIRLLLDALARQTFPKTDMEVVVADGMSNDGTLQQIENFQIKNPHLKVRVIENHKRIIPAALNRAIEAASGEYIIRLDAHSVPHPEYVARSVAGLEQQLGENVGGVWKIVPSENTWIARSIAAAASHPLGVGDAKYRYADSPGEVDTVPFGAFRRDYLLSIGGFDESLLANEDYELNTRIRQTGGKLWLDPNIQVQYYSRATLGQLARQYWRYGYWKAVMLRRYPGSLRWRQALPPLFVLGLIGLLAASIWIVTARWLLVVATFSYAMALLLSGMEITLQGRKFSLFFGVPLVIATMHIAWGSAFLVSALSQLFGKKSAG
ncbi:MAG TPA: glycosyltransferase family 2 protein [Chloroflexi bacterium]|nr:glycosyltransferase family 2 protein [Chloroflexota bacterium]